MSTQRHFETGLVVPEWRGEIEGFSVHWEGSWLQLRVYKLEEPRRGGNRGREVTPGHGIKMKRRTVGIREELVAKLESDM